METLLGLCEGTVLGGCALLGAATLLARWGEQRRAARLFRLTAGMPTSDPIALRERLAAERALLLRLLTPEQARSYQQTGRFDIRTPGGGHYRLSDGAVNNVCKLDKYGRAEASLCIMPRHRGSEAAQLTAQILLLQSDEAAFCKIANVTRHF